MAIVRSAFAWLILTSALAGCATPESRPSQPEASSAFRAGMASAVAGKQMAAAANPLATEAGLAARPPLLYWRGATVDCIHRVWALREEGVRGS